MVTVKIYPACLECDYSRFVGETGRVSFPWDKRGVKHDVCIQCEYECVCKFIDGQEPIKIGE